MAGGGVAGLIRALWGEAESFCPEPAEGSVRATGLATLIVINVARIDLIVGGAWLVASRLGMRPMGIQEPLGY